MPSPFLVFLKQPKQPLHIKVKIPVHNSSQKIIKYSLIITMLHSERQSQTGKAVIKFIDIVIDLYSPVPYELRNQLRVFQSMLLYAKPNDLDEYLRVLQGSKESKKDKDRYATGLLELPVPNPTLQKSGNKVTRNVLGESDKQNKFYLNNMKINVSDNLKRVESSLNLTVGQPSSKSRKISAAQYINREEQAAEQKPQKQGNQSSRLPSRTLLKIVKKNRSSKQRPMTQRSLEENSIKCVQNLKNSVQNILAVMSQNEGELEHFFKTLR